MKKPIQIILCLLLIITIFSGTNVFAELKANPKQFAKAVVTKFKSVRSINKAKSIVVLGAVTGKVILTAPKKLLNSSLRSIFSGNGKRPSPRKIIKVKGTNTGSIISVRGIGKQGNGYSFSIVTPRSINIYSKRNNKKFSGKLKDNVEASFDDDFGRTKFNSDGSRKDHFQGKRTKKKGVLNGTFQKKTDRGVAKGRFILKFSKRR